NSAGAKSANGAASRGAGGGGGTLCVDRVGGERGSVLRGPVRPVAAIDRDGAAGEARVRRLEDPDAVRWRRRRPRVYGGRRAAIARRDPREDAARRSAVRAADRAWLLRRHRGEVQSRRARSLL